MRIPNPLLPHVRSYPVSHSRLLRSQRQSLRRIPLIIALAVVPLFSTMPAHADKGAAVVNVRVRESKLRAQPKFWANSVSDLRYSESLTILSNEAGWLKVRTSGGKQGYVHPSVVTEKKIILASEAAVRRSADPSEVVLAGKGFSKEVEREYALSNPELNFKAVDTMERVKVSDQELVAFLREGKLGKGAL